MHVQQFLRRTAGDFFGGIGQVFTNPQCGIFLTVFQEILADLIEPCFSIQQKKSFFFICKCPVDDFFPPMKTYRFCIFQGRPIFAAK